MPGTLVMCPGLRAYVQLVRVKQSVKAIVPTKSIGYYISPRLINKHV